MTTAANAAVVNMGFAIRLVRQYCWHGIVNESLILIRNGESIRPRVMRAVSRGVARSVDRGNQRASH